MLVLFASLVTQISFSKVFIKQSVEIGGIQQWIQIQCEKEQAPVLLFLHGGPGNSVIRYADSFTSKLQNHFMVVQWDQRDTGKTLELNPSPQPLSLALIEGDVIQMIDYLRERFSQPKIFLMGHSWGGFLALRMAALCPDKLAACFAISPMIAQCESERRSLAWMIEQAKYANNKKALSELETINVPFENADEIYTHRFWLARFTNNKPAPRAFVEKWASRWLGVFNEGSALDFRATTQTFHCPVYFFIGRNDYQTHFSIAQEYHQLLLTKKKELFWFNNSGHNLNLTEPKKLQQIIVSLLTKINYEEAD